MAEFTDEFVKDFTKKFHNKKGAQQIMPLEINGIEYRVVREVREIHGKGTVLVDKLKIQGG